MLRTITHVCFLICCSALIPGTGAYADAESNSSAGSAADTASERTHTIDIVNHGYHSGIVFHIESLSGCSFPELEYFEKNSYVEIGWGERAFYQNPDPDAVDVLGALLWPSESVMHIVGFNVSALAFFSASSVVTLPVSKIELDSMCEFISAEIERNSTGAKASSLGSGLYGESHFFPGKHRYHAARNCNAWAAEVLSKAGCPEAAGYVITSEGVEDIAKSCSGSRTAKK